MKFDRLYCNIKRMKKKSILFFVYGVIIFITIAVGLVLTNLVDANNNLNHTNNNDNKTENNIIKEAVLKATSK